MRNRKAFFGHRKKLIFVIFYNIMEAINDKVGNEMGSFFNPDGSVMKALSRLADLAILNILWLICSLPIVTVGAATTALVSVTMKMTDDKEGYIFRSYIKAFRKNFKQSTIAWLIILVVILVLGADYYIMCQWDSELSFAMKTIVILAALIVLFVGLYMFPLIAKFENTMKEYFRNAFFMSIRHLPYTALLVVIFAIQVYVDFSLLINTQYWPILVLFGETAFVYVMSYIYERIFEGYINESENEKTI